MLFAGVALFVKFKLESFRADIELALEERLGAHLSTGAISVNGLRGLRIDDLEVTLADPGGPHIRIENHLTLVDIDLTDLLYGRVTVDRIVLNNSSVTITRPETVDWYDPEQFNPEAALPLETGDAFRVTGKNCRLSILNVVGDTRIDIERFRFDISRLKDANDIVATFEAATYPGSKP